MTTLNLPPPSFYQDKLNYAYEWSDYKKQQRPAVQSVTIFDLAFGSSEILVACTSTGELCFFQLLHDAVIDEDNHLDDDDDDDDDDNNHSPDVSWSAINKTCLHRFQLTQGSLYSLKIQSETDRTWLIASGDGGVWLFDWYDIQESVVKKSQTPSPPKHHHFKLHPSPHESAVEVNETCFQHNSLWGAAGDDFGCYKWDVETCQIITTYRSKFLQTMTLIPNTNILLTGGEEGTLNLWDTQQDRLIETIEIQPNVPSKTMTNTINTEKRGSTFIQSTRISCAIARDENWWTIGGERSHTGHTRQQTMLEKSGFLATFHGPTRSIVSQIELRETPQKLAYANNNHEAVVSVANENYVSHFNNALDLESPERVWCHSQSAFAAAVSKNGILAVAGVGSTIDLYRNQTELIGTLRL